MNKNVKKALCALLGLIIILSLAACGDKKDDTAGAEPTKAAAQATVEPTAEPTPEPKAISARSFIGGYIAADAVTQSAILVNLLDDGSLKIYTGTVREGEYLGSAEYEGSWTKSENDEGDETVSYSFKANEDTEVTLENAKVLDGVFRGRLYFEGDGAKNVMLYEMAYLEPAEKEVYIAYLAKKISMGTIVYGDVLNLRDNGTFTAATLQNTPMGANAVITGIIEGTYTVNEGEIKLIYPVLSDTDEDNVADSVLTNRDGVPYSEWESVFKNYTGDSFSGAFVIGIVDIMPSAAQFIRIR